MPLREAQAVALMVRLKDVAEYQDTMWDFEAHIQQVRTQYTRLHGLLRRMRQAGVMTEDPSA